jgi:preprotein translocase subunit SecG
VRTKSVLAGFGIVQGVMGVLFAAAALVLTLIAARTGWVAAMGGLDLDAAQQIIEAVGLLAAAVVALQIAQTIAEEEVIRAANVSGPTRVRRFLSRFMVVLVVALVVEALVGTFKALHDDMRLLVYPAALLGGCALLLAAWGVFLHLNRSAEELEPEAMEQAKREDRKLT